jgi:hypothetical protein
MPMAWVDDLCDARRCHQSDTLICEILLRKQGASEARYSAMQRHEILCLTHNKKGAILKNRVSVCLCV